MKIIKRNGLQANPLAGIADPTAREAVCLLCGRYMAVDVDSYCRTDECSEAALDYAKRHPELRALIDVGSIKILLLTRLERHSDPVPPDMYVVKPDTDGDHCEIHECTQFARPRDLICVAHRLAHPKHRRRLPKASGVENRIKGLADIKLK